MTEGSPEPPPASEASGPPALSMGELVDQLSIENIRLWYLQNRMDDPDDAIAGPAARLVNEANARRVAYRAEITRRLEGGFPDGARTYTA